MVRLALVLAAVGEHEAEVRAQPVGLPVEGARRLRLARELVSWQTPFTKSWPLLWLPTGLPKLHVLGWSVRLYISVPHSAWNRGLVTSTGPA